MSETREELENYLDELFGNLHGTPRAVRRMMTETEEHLYDCYADGLTRGLDEATAARDALVRFGPVELVAAQWNAHAPADSVAAFSRRLISDLLPLAGIGLIAIGISGIVERIMTAIWGTRIMFADPPGTHYTAGQCHYWQFLRPRANGCTAAYLAESLSDGTQARYAAGIAGLALLTVISVVRRRQGRRLLATPSLLGSFTAAALFTAAAVALFALGGDDLRVANGNGAGQWLSGAVIAAPLALLYSWQFLRIGRRTRLPIWAGPS